MSSAALEFRVRSPCKGWKPKSYLVRNLNFGCDLKVIAIQVVLHHFASRFWQQIGTLRRSHLATILWKQKLIWENKTSSYYINIEESIQQTHQTYSQEWLRQATKQIQLKENKEAINILKQLHSFFHNLKFKKLLTNKLLVLEHLATSNSILFILSLYDG